MQYLSPQDAAKMLSVSVHTIRRWIRTGKLRSIRWGDHQQSRLRIPDDWLHEDRGVSCGLVSRPSPAALERMCDDVRKRLGMRSLSEPPPQCELCGSILGTTNKHGVCSQNSRCLAELNQRRKKTESERAPRNRGRRPRKRKGNSHTSRL